MGNIPLKPYYEVPTTPIKGQEPGTSGLRKKTKEFMSPNYLENFVQSAYDAIKESGTDLGEGSLLIGGDGRYYNNDAIQIIIQMGVANGVRRFWVAQDGLMSTPAISATIRERGPIWQKAFGAFILTASHNPGGPDEDFGYVHVAATTKQEVISCHQTYLCTYRGLDFSTAHLDSCLFPLALSLRPTIL